MSVQCCRLLRRLPKIGFLLRFVSTKNQTVEEPVTASNQGSHDLKCVPVPAITANRHHLDQNVLRHFRWIGKFAPGFSVNGNQIKVLNDPHEFYDALKRLSRGSKKRIVLASLYLGTGKLEQDLVDCVYDAVRESEDVGGDLRVKFLFDFMRGSRGEKNSRTMLMPLIKNFGPRVSAALYHTPDLRGIVKKVLPERYNETVGVSHMKVYIFDDTLIMSGANLSDSYFTDRQDRYVVINDCSELANFFEQLVTVISSLSFQLQLDNKLSYPLDLQCHPFKGRDRGMFYRNEMHRAIDETIQHHRNHDDDDRFWSKTDAASDDGLNMTEDTIIYPLIQMKPFNITYDEIVTNGLFRRASRDVTIYLASGYFNLTKHYMNSIINDCKAKFEILTAAPQANGFFGAAGISGAIPDAYTYIAKQFYTKVLKTEQLDRIKMYEYLRHKWTVHAKGLWYHINSQPFPIMTMIGSPNFGYRSVFRDLEAQVVIVTQNKELQMQLQEEQTRLFSHSEKVTSETFVQTTRQIPLWVTYVTPIIRNFF